MADERRPREIGANLAGVIACAAAAAALAALGWAWAWRSVECTRVCPPQHRAVRVLVDGNTVYASP